MGQVIVKKRNKRKGRDTFISRRERRIRAKGGIRSKKRVSQMDGDEKKRE